MTIENELARLFGAKWLTDKIPEAPMPYTEPDLGHPLQHAGEPVPFELVLTPQERDAAVLAQLDLLRQRQEANLRDRDQELAALGVEFLDGGAK